MLQPFRSIDPCLLKLASLPSPVNQQLGMPHNEKRDRNHYENRIKDVDIHSFVLIGGFLYGKD